MSDLAMNELYQQMILEHNKKPRNFHEMEDPTHHAEGYNPLCGDRLTLYIRLNGENRIEDISFEGSGCAISKSSASLMTETLKGKIIEEANQMFESFHGMLTRKPEKDGGAPLGKLKIFEGVSEYPSRIKCATLCWHTFKAALEKTETVTTE